MRHAPDMLVDGRLVAYDVSFAWRTLGETNYSRRVFVSVVSLGLSFQCHKQRFATIGIFIVQSVGCWAEMSMSWKC